MRMLTSLLSLSILISCTSEANYVGGDPMRDASKAVRAVDSDLQKSGKTVERKIIKSGFIEFEVSDVEATKKTIAQLTNDFAGYISSEDQNKDSGSPRYRQTVRVPSAKLDEFISKVEELSRNIESKAVDTKDVTEEFIDVETRLRTKKALEERFLDLLKKAHTVSEIIDVENQLSNVRTEIESMEGKLKYLTNKVDFSTLHLEYYQSVSGTHGFGYRFSQTFGNGWHHFLNFIIAVFEIWPFVIMSGLIIWLLIRWRRRRKQQTISSSPQIGQ